MKQTYRILASLIVVGVLVQAAAIAFGWFDVLNKVDEGSLVLDGEYEGNAGHMIHGIVGMTVIPLVSLLLLISSFFAAKSVPGARKWGAIVFGAVVLQVVLAFVAFGAPVVGALHGMNALVVLLTALKAASLTRSTATAGSASVPAQASGASTGSTLSV